MSSTGEGHIAGAGIILIYLATAAVTATATTASSATTNSFPGLHILMGQESKHLTDFIETIQLTSAKNKSKKEDWLLRPTNEEDTLQSLAEFSKSRGDENAAKREFSNIAAKVLTRKLTGVVCGSATASAAATTVAKPCADGEFRVQYDQPEDHGSKFTTNYRYLPADAKYGLPKGRKQGHETLLQTARREFREEIGYSPDTFIKEGTHYIDIKIHRKDGEQTYRFFIHEVNDALYGELNKAIEARKERHYSELYNVGFKSYKDIRTMKLNALSERALLRVLESRSSGGSRRRTRRRQTRKQTRRHRR